MARMYARVIGGVAAWILGAVLATALSLFAISALGEGLSTEPVRTLTSDDVARALAAASASAPASATVTPSDSTSPTNAPATRWPLAVPSPAPSAPQAPPTADRGTAVGSTGGAALAVCGPSGVYLTSWSPAQGYLVKAVSRGPSRVASVTFATAGTTVLLRVGCPSGVPAAQATTASEDNPNPDSHDR